MSQRRPYHPTDFGQLQWARLLEHALERADTIEFALPYRFVAQDLWHAALWPRRLESFRGDLVERHVSLVRWDRLREEATQFVSFRSSAQLGRMLRAVPRLEAWSWRRDLPEDPVFRAGGQVLLATESRAGRITVFADPAEAALLVGAGVRLVEPLGVRAEPWPTP